MIHKLKRSKGNQWSNKRWEQNEQVASPMNDGWGSTTQGIMVRNSGRLIQSASALFLFFRPLIKRRRSQPKKKKRSGAISRETFFFFASSGRATSAADLPETKKKRRRRLEPPSGRSFHSDGDQSQCREDFHCPRRLFFIWSFNAILSTLISSSRMSSLISSLQRKYLAFKWRHSRNAANAAPATSTIYSGENQQKFHRHVTGLMKTLVSWLTAKCSAFLSYMQMSCV